MLNLLNQRFGRLIVIASTEARGKGGSVMWRCKCDCGARRTISSQDLRRKSTQSCGCLLQESRHTNNKSHGHVVDGKPSTTYVAWANMIQKCSNPRAANFAKNGGQGIKVCEHWLTFENFLADMGTKPEGARLGRANKELGYDKQNCRWTASAKLKEGAK